MSVIELGENPPNRVSKSVLSGQCPLDFWAGESAELTGGWPNGVSGQDRYFWAMDVTIEVRDPLFPLPCRSPPILHTLHLVLAREIDEFLPYPQNETGISD